MEKTIFYEICNAEIAEVLEAISKNRGIKDAFIYAFRLTQLNGQTGEAR